MHVETDAGRWAQEVFGCCELGDSRRTERLVKVASSLAAHAGRMAHAACRGDAAANEGAYRLLRNEAVEAEAIAQGGYAASIERARRCSEVLAVEDTTTLSYGHAVRFALGDLGGPSKTVSRGMHVHSVLLLERSSGRTLGLAYQQRWCREDGQRGQRHQRRERAYVDKESFKWEQASQQLSEGFGADLSRVISICDREADVYEYLSYKVGHGQRFVVRAAWDRRTRAPARHLFAEVEAAAVMGEALVQVPQRGGRRARVARLALRGCTVELREPKARDTGGAVRVNVVLAQETGPPSGESGLRWLLLTSEPVGDAAAIGEVLRMYALRWRVEEYHKAWKSGTRVEHARLQSAGNLERLAVILGFVAVRLLQLREALDTPAEHARPCTEILDETQWKVLWLTRTRRALPATPPSLRWAYEALARLGGWGDSKRTGRAGWDTLWSGWFALNERVDGFRIAQQLALEGKV
jgi:hypothetical protein